MWYYGRVMVQVTPLTRATFEVPHIEGSVHKGCISIYFRFWDCYTIRQISTSPTSL